MKEVLVRLRKFRFFQIFLIALFALGLRVFAANRLPINADESTYVNSALEYANYLRNGEYTWLAWSTTNYEHPSLNKILYGLIMLLESPIDRLHDKDVGTFVPIETSEARPWIIPGRYFSAFFGVLTVLLLAIVHPLAGLMLAVNTLNIHFTSIMYLEAFPLFASFLAVIGYQKYIESTRNQVVRSDYRWLALSAVFLGITAASKYIYTIAGIAILVHFIFWAIQNKPRNQMIYSMVAWGLLSLFCLFAFNPYLWPHPIERLLDSLTFHLRFSSSSSVTQFQYPWWQPLKWFTATVPGLFASIPSAFIVKLDLLITIFALIGLPRLMIRNPLFFIWLIVGIATLLLWPTKWPQYPMIVMVPYSLSACQGALWVVEISNRILKTAQTHVRK